MSLSSNPSRVVGAIYYQTLPTALQYRPGCHQAGGSEDLGCTTQPPTHSRHESSRSDILRYVSVESFDLVPEGVNR